MATQELRDSNGRFLGTITEINNGTLELRDNTGRFKGTYDPKTNETRDNTGRFVGTGNLLTTLLTS